MNPDRLTIITRLGSTDDIPIRVEGDIEFALIASISKGAPCRIVTQAANPLLDGWRTQVVDAAGMIGLNDAPAMRVTVINDTTIDLAEVSTLGQRAHTAGTGALKFRAPKDLSGYTAARMDIKRAVGGAVLASLSTTDGTIEIDAPNGAVWLHITPTTLVELAAGDYVFDIELLDGTDVLALCSADSVLHLLPEITTST